MQTYIVDSFTDKPFAGNPAGVCIVEHGLDEPRMLLVAQELGLSETAFIRDTNGDDDWSIRFFSPVMEIPLCGHATLASAAVLFERLGVPQIRFTNINDLVLIAKSADQGITLEFLNRPGILGGSIL
jgi:PhzF family phenazine biosynthesis protein